MMIRLEDARPVLARTIAETMAKHAVPGAALGVILDDQEHVEAFGITNVEAPVVVDGDTLFQVGSTTKTLTATAILRLVEEGRLDLSMPVRAWLPDLELATRELTERVTLEHLLSHTSGFDGDLFEDFGPGDDALARAVGRMRELPPVTPLGKVWNYSNAGYSLAGRVLEVVTGLSYEQAIQDLVLAPLGMNRSFFLAAEAITCRVAAGHRVTSDGPVVLRPWQLPRAINPAGGLISSVRDQLRYARFHLGDGTAPDGTRLLSEKTLREMRRPRIEAGGGRAAFGGLSWLIQRTPGVIAHGGSTIGQESSFVIVPARRFAITVLTNADRGAIVHSQVVRWALRNLVELERPPEDDRRLSGEVLRRYEGRYAARLQAIDITATGDALRLTLIAKERIPGLEAGQTFSMSAEAFEGGGIRVTDGPATGQRGELLKEGEEGTWLRIFGRVHVRE